MQTARPRWQRYSIAVAGWLLVLAGIAGMVLPGPGLLLLAAGLWTLSHVYEWAAEALEPVKRQAFKSAKDSVQTWPRIIMSTLGGLSISAFGVVYLIDPPAPSWWPVEEKWWLFGGSTTGVVMIVSGIVAVGLVVWSYRTFRVKGVDLDTVFAEHNIDDD